MPFSGEDWPYEALKSVEETLQEGQASILLFGEQQDVIGLHDILMSYSSIKKYGRPFQKAYELRVRRPDKSLMFAFEALPYHRQFTVQEARTELLRQLLPHCDTLLYEIVTKKDGEIIRERNFEYNEQGTLNEAVYNKLIELGWTPPYNPGKKVHSVWYGVYNWNEAKEKKKKGEKMHYHTVDRWWNELSHLWKNRHKKP